MEKAVYITGAGIISSIGIGKAQVLQSLLKKESGIQAISNLDTIHKGLPAGEVALSDSEMRTLLNLSDGIQANRTSLMGSIALKEALEDAQLSIDECKDAYLVSGTTVGGMDYTERHYLEMLENDEHLHLLKTHECGATTKAMADALGLGGLRMTTISTACSSAANAIIMGANLIKTGRADIVIAGGAEALSKFHLNGFNTLMILDREPCRPFDRDRAGLNLGEGAAYIVLESEHSVRKRGLSPQFQIDGYGNACDAYHQTASSDNGDGAYLAMRQALEMADLSPADIGYVNAHGTGTPNNDISELCALRRVFGQNLPAVSSTKSFTGHTTSASGSIETVICLLALKHGFYPANLGWANEMPGGIRPTLGKENVRLEHVMCNSFGFGGNDSSLVLSKAGRGENQASIAHAQSPIYVKSICARKFTSQSVDVSEFVPKLEARRMCSLLKAAFLTSLTALKEARIETPDGIITATKYGMLENSEKFLTQMCIQSEELLKPTLFMQSTHNTISGALAIKLKCYGYNTTFSNGANSLEDALLDARLQLELGRCGNILVGYHNELTPYFFDMEKRLYGSQGTIGITSVSMVLSTDSKDALCCVDDLDVNRLVIS